MKSFSLKLGRVRLLGLHSNRKLWADYLLPVSGGDELVLHPLTFGEGLKMNSFLVNESSNRITPPPHNLSRRPMIQPVQSHILDSL